MKSLQCPKNFSKENQFLVEISHLQKKHGLSALVSWNIIVVLWIRYLKKGTLSIAEIFRTFQRLQELFIGKVSDQKSFLRFFHKYCANSEEPNVTAIAPAGKRMGRNPSRLLLFSAGLIKRRLTHPKRDVWTQVVPSSVFFSYQIFS